MHHNRSYKTYFDEKKTYIFSGFDNDIPCADGDSGVGQRGTRSGPAYVGEHCVDFPI